MKLVVVLAAIGVSVAATTSTMRSSAVDGQILSVLAVEVSPAPAAAGVSLH